MSLAGAGKRKAVPESRQLDVQELRRWKGVIDNVDAVLLSRLADEFNETMDGGAAIQAKQRFAGLVVDSIVSQNFPEGLNSVTKDLLKREILNRVAVIPARVVVS